MKLLTQTLFFLIALSSFAFAQTDKPTIGTLNDIKGKNKFYVTGDAEVRAKIIEQLKRQKNLVPVSDPTEAEFFIEYRPLSQQSMGYMQIERGELEVYIIRDGKKIIAWSRAGSNGAYKAATAGKLAGQLASDLKKQSSS